MIKINVSNKRNQQKSGNFIALACGFKSEVSAVIAGKEINAKSIMKAPMIESAAACITQTIHFSNVEGKGSEYGKRKVQEEVQENGSVMMEIVKEYGNNKSVGNYLD